MRRGELSDQQWQRLEPHLPAQKSRTGRPNLSHRQIINGILWVLRTGAPWRDLPERYGPWSTISTRYYRWCKNGLWDRILATLQAEADAAGARDWEAHYVDGRGGRAQQHGAGAKGGSKIPRP